MSKKLTGTVKCPECGHQQKMEIPVAVCMQFYRCEGCKKLIKGTAKCIFCSYADKKCPSGCL
ncbi:MAG: hypothetical protein HYY37_05345 [Candidatus Aenigmarchaeota archaeon]|nr:hypothetical protein [Candidatus Aenigmarchaeota archaeon]